MNNNQQQQQTQQNTMLQQQAIPSQQQQVPVPSGVQVGHIQQYGMMNQNMMQGAQPGMPMNGMMMPPMGQGNPMTYNNMSGGHGKPMNNMKIQKSANDLNEKYKTERCRHYETHKNCALGDMCHFAHGDVELRKPDDPLNPEQQAVANKAQQFKNCNQENQPNRQFQHKGGQYGGYQQNMGGQGNFRGGGRGGYNNRGGGMRGGGGGFKSRGGGKPGPRFQYGQQQNNTGGNQNFKTVKCKFFEQNGTCKFGDRCSFAHGDEDLRKGQMENRPNFSQAPNGMDDMQNFQGQFSNMMQMPISGGQTTGQQPNQSMFINPMGGMDQQAQLQQMIYMQQQQQQQQQNQNQPAQKQNPQDQTVLNQQNQQQQMIPNYMGMPFNFQNQIPSMPKLYPIIQNGVQKNLQINQVMYDQQTQNQIQNAFEVLKSDTDKGLSIFADLQGQQKLYFAVYDGVNPNQMGNNSQGNNSGVKGLTQE